MDITNLKRDARVVNTKLGKVGSQYLAKERLRVLVPAYYETKKLLTFGAETYFLGFYCIVTEDNYYAIDICPSMIQTDPTSITRTEINGMEYIVFVYEPGDAVIANENVVKDEPIGFDIFNEILAKGLFPWWMNYEDACKIFSKMRKFTGSSIGDNHIIYEVIVSSLARDPEDRGIQYRQGLKNKNDIRNRPPVWSPLRSVQFSAVNTVAKLAGSFFIDGAISALNDPTERVERGEQILRQ